MNRVLPLFVSFLGSLGLASAFAYLLLIVRAFGPGGDAVIDFLIGSSDEQLSLGFLTVFIPYVLLLAHMYMRIRVGDWLLDRGAEEGALKYAERRMKSTPLRARKEAIAHRAVVARVYLRRRQYEEAWRVLEAARKLPRRGPFLARLRRWQLETALRRENLVDAHQVIEATGSIRSRSGDAAAFHACVAEVAVREGDRPRADEALKRADWADEDHPRTRLVRAFVTARFEAEEIQPALDALDDCGGWLDDVPGASAEILAVKARLIARQGDVAMAWDLLERADATDADPRSEWVVGQVREELGEADGS